jgi:hypothetical protein
MSGQLGGHAKYDRQVVLGLHVKSFDLAIDVSVRGLYEKAKGAGIPCDMVFWFESPDWKEKLEYKTKIFSALTWHSRLYIVGHGDWKNHTVAGYDAKKVANLIVNVFQLKAVGLINVAACSGGSGSKPDDAGGVALENSSASFAEAFHRLLGTKHGIYTWVHAYNRIVALRGRKTDRRIYKVTKDADDPLGYWHRAGGKILWYWEGGQQKKMFVNYPEQLYGT